MHIKNSIHYSSDPYLLSQYKYKAEHKAESQPGAKKNDVSISEAALEEKNYAKSINALQPAQDSIAAGDKVSGTDSSAQKAIDSYAEVGAGSSPQQQFNLIEEMV